MSSIEEIFADSEQLVTGNLRGIFAGSEADTPLLLFIRADSLPEHHRYEDDGCEVARQCVACPLPVCRYEVSPKIQLGMARQAAVRRRKASGMTIAAIVADLGISRRAVFRALA